MNKPTNIELTLWLTQHIKYPCEDGLGNNVRLDYVYMAKEVIEKKQITNPYAQSFLENIVKMYDKR